MNTDHLEDEPLPTAEQIETYLYQHPDFLVARPELVETLTIPHPVQGAISLLEYQVMRLRTRNQTLERHLSGLMEVARLNDRLFDKTRRLILELLDAGSLEEVVSALEDGLRHLFQIPYCSLQLFAEQPLPVGQTVSRAQAQAMFPALVGDGAVLCGALSEAERSFLFAEAADSIGSMAVVPVASHGLLAVGSPDPDYYRSTLGTLFLSQLADVLGRVLPRFLDAGEHPDPQ